MPIFAVKAAKIGIPPYFPGKMGHFDGMTVTV
jgi:hypothetical protein